MRCRLSVDVQRQMQLLMGDMVCGAVWPGAVNDVPSLGNAYIKSRLLLAGLAALTVEFHPPALQIAGG